METPNVGGSVRFLSGVPVRMQFQQNTNTDNTISEMKKMVFQYYSDLADYADWTLEDFFDLVKNLPYKMEETSWGAQILQRPSFTLRRLVPVVACANKAILISSFLTMHGIKNGFVVTANSPAANFSHVFNWAEFGNSGVKVFIDATYPQNVIYREKLYPKRKVYP